MLGTTPDPAQYLFCTFWASTRSPAPVIGINFIFPSLFHIRLWKGQLYLQLQIHICVVPFKGPVHLHLQSHLCLTLEHRGSTPDPAPAPAPNLCCTFWGSTPSPASVPSLFHIRLCGGLIPSPDPYKCCTFEGQLHLWLQSHPHLTLDHRWSTPSMAPASDPYLCYTFWGPTPSLAPVPSMFHLRSWGWVNSIYGSRSIFVPLPPYYLEVVMVSGVVHFEGPLHHQLQFNVHFALDYVEGINSMSGSNSRTIFVLHLWGSTPSLPPVLSMSHLRS